MKRECTEAENRIIKECGKDVLTRPEIYRAAFQKKKRLPGNKFWVNGGTVIKYINHSEDGPLLVFTEDNLTDIMGKPCCITYPAPYCLNITPGERILLVYSDAGAYIPIRITERTRNLALEYGPQSFGSVNWNEAVRLPHPAAMDMDQGSYMMNEYEIKEAVKKCNRVKSIRTRNWIGIIMFSFLILFLAALLFIGLVAGEIITEFSSAVVFVALVLLVWLLLTFGFAKIVLAGHIRGLKKIQYKKRVLFCSVDDAYENNFYAKYISVFEYVNGKLELVSYPVTNNYFLPKSVPYGKMIYKYSKEAKSCAKDLNIFCLMD